MSKSGASYFDPQTTPISLVCGDRCLPAMDSVLLYLTYMCLQLLYAYSFYFDMVMLCLLPTPYWLITTPTPVFGRAHWQSGLVSMADIIPNSVYLKLNKNKFEFHLFVCVCVSCLRNTLCCEKRWVKMFVSKFYDFWMDSFNLWGCRKNLGLV